MMVATGNVLIRKKALQDTIRGKDPDQVWPASDCQCHSNAHTPEASTIVFTLKRSLTGLSLLPAFGKVCAAEETSAINIPSSRLSSAAAIRINGRFTDMFPLMPGKFSFMREATAETASSTKNG